MIEINCGCCGSHITDYFYAEIIDQTMHCQRCVNVKKMIIKKATLKKKKIITTCTRCYKTITVQNVGDRLCAECRKRVKRFKITDSNFERAYHNL